MESFSCLFVKRGIVLICYVADLFLFEKNETHIEEIEREASNKFRINDCSKLKSILGIDSVWQPDGSLFISEKSLIGVVQADTRVESVKRAGSSIEQSSVLNGREASAMETHRHGMYRCVVGSLMNLEALSRLDHAVVASMLPSHVSLQ